MSSDLAYCRDAMSTIDSCYLRDMPYRLSPFLTRLMNAQIDTLVKLGESDISNSLTRGIQIYAKTNDATHLCLNWSEYRDKDIPKYQRNSIVRRLSLTKMYKRSVRKCLALLASSNPKEIKELLRCPPLGMNGSTWVCRSVFCPNCRMRSANRTLKRLKARYEVGTYDAVKAIVLEVDLPFIERRFGYDPELNDSIMRGVRNRMSKTDSKACRTLGITILDEKPYVALRFAFFIAPNDEQTALAKLVKYQKYLRAKHPDFRVSVEAVEGLDNICLQLYDAAPTYLLGLPQVGGFSSSLLHHTVEQFKTLAFDKKKISFFETGV